ncbi:RagB/SusD family nutrient uptake outer membrane protein [Chitinophaga sp. SYP-B3965]|uniref:RagB/SusD family nutrient uptake outer membrane protein n=1 Tax=Chitinophaga sp. SYP-B3965 TaxID=2663120 RepID=UPI00129A0767|nr:RagB/SusD family nutrient uptake outer membrane protein [Chitinophaga sp. SYP-B3965]MRG45801.1 RagB/SusD family nutrient uptake outer membrane protein [Chitinophaga sp. SYP-B3965]
MKRIYLFAWIMIAGLSSCKKFLDTKPTDFYTPDNYYNTEAQLQQALTGVYGDLMRPELYAQVIPFNFTTTTDEVLSNRTADGDTRGLRYNYDASQVYVGNLWRFSYVGIANLNSLLLNINKPEMDSTKRNIIKGQALFLRGFLYFTLTSNYGDVPLILRPLAINETTIPAAAQKDVYAQIEKDMKEAEELLKNYTTAKLGYNDVATLSAVQAMLARVYLYWAGYPLNDVSKYQDVITYTSKVVNSGLHALNPDYRQIFINLSKDQYDVKENIWEIGSYGAAPGVATKSGNDIGNFVGISSAIVAADTASYSSASWVWVTRKLFDAYEVDPANTATPLKSSLDVRRDWNCANYIWGGTPRVRQPRPNVWQMSAGKFRREYCPAMVRNVNGAAGAYNINWPVIRYSDVLLMRAEAENYVNGPANAYADINLVRRRGYGIMNGNVVKSVVVNNQGSGYTVAPTVTITGGGGSGATGTAVVTSGKVVGVYLSSPGALTAGSYYSSAPFVIIGTAWTAGTAYAVGTQITNAGNLYTVTTTGTSTITPPTQLTGASSAAVTGAVFTYAGVVATATATITNGTEADLTPGLGREDFQLAIRDERMRELCFEAVRKADLIRWGNFYQDMQTFAAWAGANGASVTATGNPNGLQGAQNVGTRHVLLPKPTYELNLNRALIQNTGW